MSWLVISVWIQDRILLCDGCVFVLLLLAVVVVFILVGFGGGLSNNAVCACLFWVPNAQVVASAGNDNARCFRLRWGAWSLEAGLPGTPAYVYLYQILTFPRTLRTFWNSPNNPEYSVHFTVSLYTYVQNSHPLSNTIITQPVQNRKYVRHFELSGLF